MIQIIDTESALQALVPDWTALWRRAGSPPFQSPAWLLPWWAAFGTGQPRLVTLRHSGLLVGLLPLYVLDEPPERKLLPIGVGLTDYLDALIDQAAPAGTATRLCHSALARATAEGITSCTLPDLPPGAALLDAGTPTGWKRTALGTTPCPVLTIGDPIPAGQLRNLRQSRHRAERSGGWRAGVAPDPVAAWQALMAMHRARWTALGQPGGVLADPAVLAFHEAAIPRLAAAGLLEMQVLHVGGTVAAVYHTLTAPGRRYFYLSGFAAEAGHASPGTLLLGHIIEQATEQEITELHFLRGAEPYKYAWGATDRTNQTIHLQPIPS